MKWNSENRFTFIKKNSECAAKKQKKIDKSGKDGPTPVAIEGEGGEKIYVYGVIDEACTSVAGPFKLAIVLKDAPTSVVERTIWIIEGNIADTNSATTF